MDPLVTAVVPSYNYARYVVRAVESCLAQTLGAVEVVVTDDASTDDSPRLLRERFGGDPRVRLELHEKNAGVSGNFNRGLRAARGKYVGFCCADDEWLPDHAVTLSAVLEGAPSAALAYARARLVDGEGKPVADQDGCGFGSCPDSEFFARLVRGANFVPFVATLFRRDRALEVGGFREDVRVMQDYGLWMRLAAHHEARFVDRESVVVRWHGENASAKGSRTSEARKRDAVTLFEDLLAREGELLRSRGLARDAKGRLRDALLRLASRTKSREEARALSRRAVELAPFSPRGYLSLVRTLVPGKRS